MRLRIGAALREEDTLSEIGGAELSVNTPEIQARRESQRPVGGLLNCGVPRESQPTRTTCCGLEQDGGQGRGRLLNQVQRLVKLIEVQ
jgi:hypothetical protein